MAEDLFEYEQQIFDDAVSCIKDADDNDVFVFEQYAKLTKEYGKLLKQLRRVTKLSDRTTVNLNTSKIDLLDQVQHDALTGIYNRRYMTESLKRIISSLARSNGVLSLLMMDIDFFKKYNDTYGHSEGDTCLKAVAETLEKSLSRADDFAARYGGEEFVIILPNTDESGARYMAGRILENIRALNIPHEKNEAAEHVTISIGVTTGDVGWTNTGDDYIRQADKALYQSKESGRNRYSYIDFKEIIWR
ncbi:MAG: GGDEF domain-containing protein [Oscillospiraceae bacterium]|jgi:diguanylate cyclase (GGDEF)-like protein|nr:GGDEF domain-containing protein [Oscillospiraceae bacterium]